MFKMWQEIYNRRELLWIMVTRNLRIRYKNSALGFLWSLLTPLCMILIYSVFAHILRFNQGRPDYLAFLIVGLVVWQFLATTLSDSLHAVLGSSNLVKKTAFPRIILPLATVAANFINFLLTLVVLVVYLLLTHVPCGGLYWLPVALLTHFALCFGAGTLIAASNVFFRDTEHILGVATLAWFFLTPIFYSVDLQWTMLPEAFRNCIYLNPMTGIIGMYRHAFMAEPLPGMAGLVVSCGVAWAVFAIGLGVFKRAQVRFADEM